MPVQFNELTHSAEDQESSTKDGGRVDTVDTIVIGAGPTGLSAAYHLGEKALLIEQNSTVGGWCRSIEDGGFTFDMAGHIMFSKEEYVHEMYRLLLGDNVHWQDREAWVFSKNVYTRYPFQGALYGLPPEVIKECIIGAIESRYGSLEPAHEPPAANNGHTHAGASTNGASLAIGRGYDGKDHFEPSDCCGDGVIETLTGSKEAAGAVTAIDIKSKKPESFEDFIYKAWGKGIAKHFAVPYNRKLWAVPLSEMETSWLGGRVPQPDLGEIIDGALSPVPRPMGPNARFGYPLRGGFQALMDGFLPHLQGELRLNTRVAAVSPAHRTLTLENGKQLRYDHLISTMPLPTLVRLMGDEAPTEVQKAAEGLRHVSVRCVNLGIGREKLTEKHWIYYPEDPVFHRIFVQGNASPHCNAPGGFGLTCEITYSEYKPLPATGQELIDLCIKDCLRVGIINDDDPVWVANEVDMPYAYVVYDHSRKHNVDLIRDWLKSKNIVLSGRYSEWEYYNSDHAFIAGKTAADQVEELRAQEATLATAVHAYRHGAGVGLSI